MQLLGLSAPANLITPTLKHPPIYRELKMPVKLNQNKPNIQAASFCIFDPESGSILESRDANTLRPIASINKLASVLVILNSHSLKEVITIPALPSYMPDDQILGLRPGQRFMLEDLLRASLIYSANDALDALAITDSGSSPAFIIKMNQLLERWGIAEANFNSATGLNESGNTASAQALAKLAALALKNKFVADTVKIRSANISDLNGKTYRLQSTNYLLDGKRFLGVKTGYTLAAGQSLISAVNTNGKTVIIVVLNSPDRFRETAILADWLDDSFQWL